MGFPGELKSVISAKVNRLRERLNHDKNEWVREAGSCDRGICVRVPHRERGCVFLAAIHTECCRTGFSGNVCRRRPAALYQRMRSSWTLPNRVGSLLFTAIREKMISLAEICFHFTYGSGVDSLKLRIRTRCGSTNTCPASEMIGTGTCFPSR